MSNEVISLRDVTDGRTTTITVDSAQTFHNGGYDPKRRLKATSAESQYYQFVERPNTKDTDGQTYLKKWQAFRDANLPVISQLWVSSNESYVFLPDLTTDGSELYGKGTKQQLSSPESLINPKRVKAATDNVFLNIVRGPQLVEVKKRVSELVDQATQNNLLLPADYDAFELLVHPNGTWELVILDLFEAKVIDLIQSGRRDNFNVRGTNANLGITFLEHLDTTARHLDSSEKTA